MNDLRNIPLKELSKASNPFHVNVCEFDDNRILEAYPQMIIEDMFSSFNQQTNEYIAKQLISLNIDKDVLIKQTEELNRLNNEVQELCDKAYERGRTDERTKVLDEFRKRIDEYLNESSDFAGFIVTDGAIDTVIEQLKERNND